MTLAIVALIHAQQAFPSCGQAVCPVESTARVEHLTSPGTFVLDASWEHIPQDQPRVGTHRTRVGGVPSPEHDEIRTSNHTYKLLGEGWLTSRLALGAQLSVPMRDHRHRVREDDEVESWNLTGFGDAQVWARYALLLPDETAGWAFDVGLGLKLPTGSTGLRNQEGERAEITLQPGTGSTDALVSAQVVRPMNLPTPFSGPTDVPVFATTSLRLTGSDGRDGYRAGTDWIVNVGTAYPLWADRLDLLGQVNFRYRDRDDAGESEGVPEQNTGGEAVFLSPGLRLQLVEGLHLYGLVQLPAFQRVNGIQLTSNWNVLAGVSYQLSIPAFAVTQ